VHDRQRVPDLVAGGAGVDQRIALVAGRDPHVAAVGGSCGGRPDAAPHRSLGHRVPSVQHLAGVLVKLDQPPSDERVVTSRRQAGVNVAARHRGGRPVVEVRSLPFNSVQARGRTRVCLRSGGRPGCLACHLIRGRAGQRGSHASYGMAQDKRGGSCPVRVKVARSRVRSRVILRGPDLGCESLPGFGRPVAQATEEPLARSTPGGVLARSP
jgi:hypothetical protein